MSRTSQALTSAIVFALITALLPRLATAALAPGTVEKMKAKATDVLHLKIAKVEKKGTSGIQLKLVYTATVLKVERTKSGRKAGDSIQIASYRIIALLPPPGPKNPPLLEAGWVGTIYLNAPKADGPYKIAVYGHSFVGKDE
jgi:hypothetical protein